MKNIMNYLETMNKLKQSIKIYYWKEINNNKLKHMLIN